ncbi:MAG TPA: hypothetical protein VHG91_03615 [Longimicrobium sp.]|nr:hypothetical protein [Longimicrobium sp.]
MKLQVEQLNVNSFDTTPPEEDTQRLIIHTYPTWDGWCYFTPDSGQSTAC